jgi:hypothetical protein
LLLAGLAGGVHAAWERVGVATDGMAVYADPATIQTAGEVVKMQALLDYKVAEKDLSGKPYLSAKLLHEYDCKGARARTRYFSLHAGQMGAGQLVYSEIRNDTGWRPADRMIIGETLWKLACGKK